MVRRDQAPNMEVFDAYFRRADLDQDGRISGAEAVAFFQGSNLPKHILAQIWMHADQHRTGFLGWAEFYNALKLVTVAQSGRELTPDIVRAALFGPAAAKIPAPQINPVFSLVSQATSIAPPVPQVNAVAPTTSQNLGFRGPQLLPNAGATSQQFFPSSDNQLMRPPQATQIAPSLPTQGIHQGIPGVSSSIAGPQAPNSNASTDWIGGRTGAGSAGVNLQAVNRGAGASVTQDGFGQLVSGLHGTLTPLPPKLPQDAVLPSFHPAVRDSKALVVSGNNLTSDSIFGGDVFSATPSQPKQDVAPAPQFSTSGMANLSSMTAPTASTGPHASANLSQLGNLTMQSGSSLLQQASSLVKQNQVNTPLGTSAMPASSTLAGPLALASAQSHLPWPRITQADIQKYTSVFVEVDTDRDGKITGEQARNLFLSWRLPRDNSNVLIELFHVCTLSEVLKQVWDLSDQDNDSMLSLKEFCSALYLMERYREGRPLPAVLPSSTGLSEALFSSVGQPSTSFSSPSLRPTPAEMSVAQPVLPATGIKAPAQVHNCQTDGALQFTQPNSGMPQRDKHLRNQLSQEEKRAVNSNDQGATETGKKLELEKEILDSREKIEFYRTKMQVLVLYKSRCDNRLNEITERAFADKREVESLSKKYEEKYKQVGEIASKLTPEEARFRDIQERKLELHNAIVKMEQGGSADGLLQVRADRIQSDLEELVKALNARCKHYGLNVKPTSQIVLPYGWEPGIQGAADWDEDWDKFEDEGFTIDGEITLGRAIPKKSLNIWDEKSRTDDGFSVASPSNLGGNVVEKASSFGHIITENGSSYAQSEDDLARSSTGSPVGSGLGSLTREFSASQFEKVPDASPRAKESDHGGSGSAHSTEKHADEAPWGETFTDANDDKNSVWGFKNTFDSKDSEHEKGSHNSFFGYSDFGLNPIRTDSTQVESTFGKAKSPFSLVDSVPCTPLFNSTLSPRYSAGSEENSFDSFTRFDSFSIHDGGGFPRDGALARFDSIRSTSDQSRGGFMSFDDGDPFAAPSLFKSTESQTPRRRSDNWRAF